MVIYKIRNKVTGKQLIGQTIISASHRWAVHCSTARKGKHSNRYFQRAWNKYGSDAFEFRVICAVTNLEELNEWERLLINIHLNDPNGNGLYNLREGGDNSRLSKETRCKIGEARKGKKCSEETKRKISEANKGENHSMWGRAHSGETKRKISKAQTGKKHSAETKRKMSKAKMGHEVSKETKRKLSEAGKGNTNAKGKGVRQKLNAKNDNLG